MNARERVIAALSFQPPDKVPFCFPRTTEADARLQAATGGDHPIFRENDSIAWVGVAGRETEVRPGHFRNLFGVVWNRTVDKDIGIVENRVLPEPSLAGLALPDPDDETLYAGIDEASRKNAHRFREAAIGFSLYERAWTMRGMAELLMDMVDNPSFVHDLLDAICDWNLKVIANFVEHDIEGVHFGDDWGAQRGLQMGPDRWRTFLRPRLARMYRAVRAAGKFVSIHSCGKVDELFDDLVDIGLNCFNPFQPEVMDVYRLHEEYFGRLAFHGGISTQRLMPYGSPDDVRKEVSRMIAMGRKGGLIIAPAHALPRDVPAENMLAMLDVLMNQ
ncbi:MAG: uroporphyrinogen decarboxylase family protein [Planctomycetota bacterium]